MHGDLTKYDWLHLFHEDFTGQLNKFYLGYPRRAVVRRAARAERSTTAKRLGFAEHSRAQEGRGGADRGSSSSGGGFLFAMCGATETLELAIAGAQRRTSRGAFADGTPIDEDADAKMDWKRTFAFRDAHVEQSPFVNSMSDIDGHQVNVPGRRQPLGTFTLFNFSREVRSGRHRCSCRIIAR